MIDYQKLAALTGFASYDSFKKAHHELVNFSLADGIGEDNGMHQLREEGEGHPLKGVGE